ncbi:uncharacterized protein EDB91DRAFT_1127413 [Suillus paluster]|uniref:uncharacterized protein n=1 Tax=Suillus paluster TaxID=48578 RepID=UPI001B86BAED|nr:uncharacterized protein EDB91DRAFT_1127413 [Suillus paluster]KAG1742673.1 hypothetical protein EDB91DRAFT_1127413 [Suillus paluster]
MFTDLFKTEWAAYIALGMITVVDIFVASSLCYLLATSRTGFSSMDSFIKTLIAYTINTGCVTGICSVAIIITCAVMPHNFIFLAVEFLLAKLYVNSFLALLNARHYLQANVDTIDSSDLRSHFRQRLYRTGTTHRVSQGEELQASRKNPWKHGGDEESSRSVQADMPQRPAIAVTVEITSFSESSP